MKVIYSRVSTDGQTTDNQVIALRNKYPDAAIVEEVASGAKKRPKLQELVERLQKGDELILTSLDRLGRRTSEILQLIELLESKGVILKSEREGVDYSTIVGKLVTQILCSVAEMERNLISERTKMGLAARKAKGIKLGRQPKFSKETIGEVISMRAAGQTMEQIKVATGVSVARIHQLTKAS
jgi:DNA invertase Pin-like site-specific DNA recombinase